MKIVKILLGLSIAFTVIISSCTDDQNNIDQYEDVNIQKRSGHLIDLLGTTCVPASIIIPGVCNDIINENTLVISNLPNYPGCNFTVIYETYICESGGLIDITVGDFQILEHDCQAFSDNIDAFQATSNWAYFIEQFNLLIYNKIEDHLIQEYVTGSNYICGSGAFFTINFLKAACNKYCTTKITKGGNEYFTSVKAACGAQCCERHTRVCQLPDGTIIKETEDVTDPFTIDCADEPILIVIPPSVRCLWESNCNVSCFE